MPKISLHIDGLMLFIAGLSIYFILGFEWWLFAALILAPDLFMLGYLIGPGIGARIYNIGHSKVWPVVLSILGMALSQDILIAVGLIWACHIGIDHLFGYGYKYEDGFKHTHFSEV